MIKYIEPYLKDGYWILETELRDNEGTVLYVACNGLFTSEPVGEELAKYRREHKRVLELKL